MQFAAVIFLGALALGGVGSLTGCGGRAPVPKRLVVEGDLGSWKFRRFQGPLVDVEVWIEGNRGEAFTASYITGAAEQRGHIEDKDLVNVFVTQYAKPEGVVRATVKFARRLAQEQNYQVEETKIAGERALTINGSSESWVLWPSHQYVVKIGGRGLTKVPDAMVESYAERFPSQLPGGALEGPLPPSPDDTPAKQDAKDPYDPKNPKPDLDRYDPKKVKIPER
ncbi:MAG: hypothetical protein H0T79_19370, partial [Deltaproteobacteria bacterium]|nr:hypothetical protein [Deltaproteobacteria bacterium]